MNELNNNDLDHLLYKKMTKKGEKAWKELKMERDRGSNKQLKKKPSPGKQREKVSRWEGDSIEKLIGIFKGPEDLSEEHDKYLSKSRR